MKNTFKPLALAAAVAALTAGSVGVVNAQSAGEYPSLGSAAFVPYYTVQDGWVTGVHIINTSDLTQVVKIRMRRAEDSRDVLDFNLILSPYDEWTGSLSGDDTAEQLVTDDKSCTAPALVGGTTAPIRGDLLDGAQEGYIEVIGMGAADSAQAISIAAKHVNGTPVDCNAVRTNFLAASVIANDTTLQGSKTNTYTAVEDVLKVSYFIRDADSGSEVGGNATHLRDFNDNYVMMTHQQFGMERFAQVGTAALNGWDFPDVRGGGNNTGDASTRESWQNVREQLGANQVMNDWSYNPATGATTDWTVNFVGQYSMIDFYQLAANPTKPDLWDYREIPVEAEFTVFDREENETVPGGLDFSPSPAPDTALLPYEVNVITWGPDGDTNNVFGSQFAVNSDPSAAGIDSPVGWASLSVSGTEANDWKVCDTAGGPVVNGDSAACVSVSGPVPMVGFAAWDRTFADPDLSYGRAVDHSFTAGSIR